MLYLTMKRDLLKQGVLTDYSEQGSTGNKVPETPGDDEDEEGRSNSERLVEKGFDEATHDQKRQAAKIQQ
jgi:hypothetical protein